MNKLIQVKVQKVLESFEITIPLDSIEVTSPKKKIYGDYTTNILLKNKSINHKTFVEILSLDPSFEKVEYVNGFINIFLLSSKIDMEDINVERKIELNNKYLFQRIKNIFFRLDEEGYGNGGDGFSNEYFIGLIKAYNNLLENTIYLNAANPEDLEILFKSMEKLDENVVYRKLRFSELSQIKDLFKSIISLIERITYE